VLSGAAPDSWADADTALQSSTAADMIAIGTEVLKDIESSME
jgi:hypothetical protein